MVLLKYNRKSCTTYRMVSLEWS